MPKEGKAAKAEILQSVICPKKERLKRLKSSKRSSVPRRKGSNLAIFGLGGNSPTRDLPSKIARLQPFPPGPDERLDDLSVPKEIKDE